MSPQLEDEGVVSTAGTKLLGFRADLAVLRERGWAKAKRQWSSVPLYRPSRHPVGAGFSFAPGIDLASHSHDVDYREALPARNVPTGDGSSVVAPALHVFAIEPARFLTDGVLFYGVLTDADAVVTDISADFRGDRDRWPSFVRLQRFPAASQVEDAVSLVTGGGGATNYAHWLYDVLPYYHLLDEAGLVADRSHFLVPPLDREFKVVTLRRLGIDPDRCIEIRGPTLIEAGRLAASSGHRSHHGRVEPWVPQFLRSAFLGEGGQTGRRLYVNRRDTRIRRVLNEAELESALAARGFTSISASDYDFQEKVDLYSSADVIVAPHGAGLANVAFCSPGTLVFEIQGDDWSDPWYGDAARAVNLNYTVIRGFRTESSPRLPDIVRHLSVDVEQVVAAVDARLGS